MTCAAKSGFHGGLLNKTPITCEEDTVSNNRKGYQSDPSRLCIYIINIICIGQREGQPESNAEKLESP